VVVLENTMVNGKGLTEKQWSTKHYTDNKRWRGWTQVLRKGKQFLIH